MNWKPKYYIVLPYGTEHKIKWPEEWGNTCAANLSTMLKEELNVGTIGSEIKLIWYEAHRHEIVKDNNITYEELENYLKANCFILSFSASGTRKRAIKELRNRGGLGFVFVDSYWDVILFQAFYNKNKKFPTTLSPCA